MRWRGHIVGLAMASCALGCGRVQFDPVDAAALGPFGAPTRIAELSDPMATDDDPSPTADLLELYFNSSRAGGPGGGDIWVAKRATAGAPWGVPVLVAELSSSASETGPEVSDDGLVLFFASDRAPTLGATDIWMSTRSSRAQPWGAPVHVPELSSTADDTAPAVRAGSLEIVFESTRGAGDANLWTAVRTSLTAPWSAPRSIGPTTADHEGSPYLMPDGRSLLFNAMRANTLGEADLYISTRATESDPFATETRIGVSGPANEEDPWMSADGHVLWFASNLTGDVELYEARR
jgi:Tol biopolymer transport system component